MTTLNEYLEKALKDINLDEVATLRKDRVSNLKKKIDDIFYSQDAEVAWDWINEVDKEIDGIIKELNDISKTSKIEFGNEKSQMLGKVVGSMKSIQQTIKQFNRALDGFYSGRNALKNL